MIIYEKAVIKAMFNDVRLNAFYLQLGSKQGWPLSSVLFSIVLEILTEAISKTKEITAFQTRKRKVKPSIYQ